MGTCLYAMVEAEVAPNEYRETSFWMILIDEVFFGKDYTLMSRISDAANAFEQDHRWPEDCSIPKYEQDDRFIDQGLSYLNAEDFIRAARTPAQYEEEPYDEPRPVTVALIAFVEAYQKETGRPVRLLFYTS